VVQDQIVGPIAGPYWQSLTKLSYN